MISRILPLFAFVAMHPIALAQVTVYQPVVQPAIFPGLPAPILSTTVIPIATGTDGFTTYIEQRVSIGTTAAPTATPSILGPGFMFLDAPVGTVAFAEDASNLVHAETIPEGAFTIVDTVSCSFFPEVTAAVCVDESELRASLGTNTAVQTVTLPLTAVATFTPATAAETEGTGGLTSRSVKSGAVPMRGGVLLIIVALYGLATALMHL